MSSIYGAMKERLGLAKPWEKAYWQPHKIESATALVSGLVPFTIAPLSATLLTPRVSVLYEPCSHLSLPANPSGVYRWHLLLFPCWVAW